MDDLELRTGLDEPLREDQYAVLFDGVCPLCNRSAQFIIARDRKKRAVFAPLQSEIGQALAPGELDTMIVLAKNRRLERSSAALFVARRLDGREPVRLPGGHVPHHGHRVERHQHLRRDKRVAVQRVRELRSNQVRRRGRGRSGKHGLRRNRSADVRAVRSSGRHLRTVR